MANFKKSLLNIFSGVAYTLGYIGLPLVVGAYVGEAAAYIVLTVLTFIAFYFLFLAVKRDFQKRREAGETSKLTKGQKVLVWGFAAFIIFSIIAADDTTTSTTSTSNVAEQEALPTAPYQDQPTNKTFYTNGTVNVRECASTNCPVMTQANTNTQLALEYSDVSEMPEWVPVSFNSSGIQKSGFLHRSTISNTYTFTPTPSYSNYPSNTHYDDSYKYEYRTGYSGDYTYNYDVEGYGDTGYSYGNVDMNGKYGEGYIYDEDGNEVYVEAEWTSYGVLEAYDEDGNYYELEAE